MSRASLEIKPWVLVVGLALATYASTPSLFAGDRGDVLEDTYYKLEKHLDEAEVGETYRVFIKDLNVGQFTVGKREARTRAAKIKEKSDKKLVEYLVDKEGEVVLGPDGTIWLTDGHHLATALNYAGVDTMAVRVAADFSDLNWTDFYVKMTDRKRPYLYLKDETGKVRRASELRGMGVSDLADDGYRSLVWDLIHEGDIRKSSKRFAEFAWVDFFRPRIDSGLLKSDWTEAERQGEKWAASPEAASENLPGFIPDAARCVTKQLKE